MGKFCQIPFPGKLRIDSVMIASPLGALSAWHSFVRHLPAFLRNDMPFNAISRAYEKEKKCDSIVMKMESERTSDAVACLRAAGRTWKNFG